MSVGQQPSSSAQEHAAVPAVPDHGSENAFSPLPELQVGEENEFSDFDIDNIKATGPARL